MKPATKLKSVVKGLYRWTGLHTEWKITFDSYALVTPEGVVLIDPMKPTRAALKSLDALGDPIGVFLTNANHDRDAHWFRKEHEIQVYAQEKATADCDSKIDVLVMDGEKLPGGLRAIHIPGICSSETAFYTKQSGGILILGDAVLNPPRQGLSLLPDEYCDDRRQARASLKKLVNLNFKTVTFAHGEPLTDGAKRKLINFIKKPK